MELSTHSAQGSIAQPPRAATVASVLAAGGAAADQLREQGRFLATILEIVAQRKRKVEQAAADLLSETRRLRIMRRRRAARLGLVVLVAIVIEIASRSHFFLWGLWWLIGGGAAVDEASRKKRREAAHALTQASEPATVGILAMAASDPDGAVRWAARKALLQVLPRVRYSDRSCIDSEQMSALLGLAQSGLPELQIALLQGLEQIGDERAIPTVETLGKSPLPRVREAAARCLPVLASRARAAHESGTLLRGSSIRSAPQSGELLRTAVPQAERSEQELIRAAQG